MNPSQPIRARSTAGAVSLVHSVLTPQGSRYTVLDEWQLG